MGWSATSPKLGLAHVAGASAVLAGLGACQSPTQVRLRINTDVACDRVGSVTVLAGAPARVDADEVTPITPDLLTQRCGRDGYIGEVVLTPDGDTSAPLAIKVVMGIGKPASQCSAADGYRDCIVARRRLAYLPHTTLRVAASMLDPCIGVSCDTQSTCVPTRACDAAGTTCVRPTACVGSDLAPLGCDDGNYCEPVFTPPVAPDAGVIMDGGVESGPGPVTDAPIIASTACPGAEVTSAWPMVGRCGDRRNRGLGPGIVTPRLRYTQVPPGVGRPSGNAVLDGAHHVYFASTYFDNMTMVTSRRVFDMVAASSLSTFIELPFLVSDTTTIARGRDGRTVLWWADGTASIAAVTPGAYASNTNARTDRLPVFANDGSLVYSYQGTVHQSPYSVALGTNAPDTWSWMSVGGPPNQLSIASDGTVVFAGSGSDPRSLRPDGLPDRTFNPQPGLAGALPAVIGAGDNPLVFFAGNARVVAYRLHGLAAPVWSVPTSGFAADAVAGLALRSDGDLVLSTRSSTVSVNAANLVVLSAADGSVRWKSDTLFSPLAMSVVVAGDDTMYAATSESATPGTLNAFTLAKTAFQWARPVISATTPIIDSDGAVILFEDGGFMQVYEEDR